MNVNNCAPAIVIKLLKNNGENKAAEKKETKLTRKTH